jgi:DNA-binding NarL/FixJ family response regulator
MRVNPEHVQLLILDHERAREHLREQLRTQTPWMIAELITRGWTAQRIARKCGRSREHVKAIHRQERRAGAAVAFSIAQVLIEAREDAECT